MRRTKSQLELALNAMSNESTGVVGEWWMALESVEGWYTAGKLYQCTGHYDSINEETRNYYYVEYTCDNGKTDTFEPGDRWRKATVEELIEFFKKEENQFLRKHNLIKLYHESFIGDKFRSEIKLLIQEHPFANDNTIIVIPKELLRKNYNEEDDMVDYILERYNLKRPRDENPFIANPPSKNSQVWVSNDEKNWYRRYFKELDSNNVIQPFIVYSKGCTSWSATGIEQWQFMSLAHKKEGEKYDR